MAYANQVPASWTAGTGKAFETAAAQATSNVPVVDPGQLVREVLDTIVGRHYDSASHIALCADGRFVGLVTVESLLAAPADARVDSLMDRDSPAVGPGVDQEVAAWKAVRHGESTLPVVDHDARFIGLIPPHRLVAILLAEHDEDLVRFGGILRNASAARASSEEPVPQRFRHRLPWLVLGLGGALVAADLVGRFEDQLRVHVMLAFFMPGIVYLADAVGTQTEVVVVRGLSLGIPMRHMVGREALTGMVLGLALGAAGGAVVAFRWADVALGLSVGISIFAASSTATAAGLLLPWAFDLMSLDPAIGSGPLATVVQDLATIWVYLAVSTALM